MKRDSLRIEWPFPALLLAVCCTWGSAAHAQIAGAKQSLQIFDRSSPPRLEFNAVVEARGASDQGYLPVRIEMTPVAKTTADRTIRIRIETHPYNRANVRDELVWDRLEIPEGTTGPIAQTVLVPMRGEGKILEVTLSEDGIPLNGGETAFSDQNGGGANSRRQYAAANNAAMLKLNILAIGGDDPNYESRFKLSRLNEPEYLVNRLALAYVEIDENWLGLSGFDVITIEYARLLEFAEKEPKRWDALAAAVHAGATLIVFECGDSLVNPITEIDGKFGIVSENRDLAWRLPDAARMNDKPIPGNPLNGFSNNSNRFSYWYRKKIGFETGPFAYRRLGFGAVVSLVAIDPSDLRHEAVLFGWIRRELSDDRFQWEGRMGLSHDSVNGEYWNFLIPGVGEVPILGFVIVITFFMVLIGPVNYLALLRFKRLAWMLFTIPLAATLFTLGLFAYAALSDGFSSRVRMRSFTELDQRSGRYSAVSRQNYFTAFPPRDGMVFPAQTAVHPLHFQPFAVSDQGGTYGGSTSWEGKEQRLTERYLLSRRQTQFMLQRSGKTDAKLEFSVVAGTPQVRNLLGTEINYLLYRDSQSRLYQIENVAAGETAKLETADIGEISRRWSQYVGADPLVTSERWQRIAQNSISRTQRYYGPGENPVSQSAGLLETGIRDLTKMLALDTQADDRRSGYAAILAAPIVDRNDDSAVPAGIPQVNRVREFHAIRGRVGP